MKILILVMIIISSVYLFADTFDNPISISLGDASMLRNYDFRALGWNSALLYKYEDDLSINISNMNIFISNSALSINYYNSIMGKYLNESDKQELLDRIPDSGLGFDAGIGTSIPFLALNYKNYAFKSSISLLSTARISKELVEFIIDDIELKEYDFSDSKGEFAAIMEHTFGYGHNEPLNKYIPYDFPETYAGINLSYIAGMNYVKIKKVKSIFTNTADGITIDNYAQIQSAGIERDTENDDTEINPDGNFHGKGFRMDLGFYSQINEDLEVGLNLKNMFAVIKWDKLCQEHIITAYGDSLYPIMEDTTLDDEITDTDTSYSISSISQNIPFELHLAAKYHWKKFDFYLDYVQGFDNSVFTSAKPKISLGSEYDILTWLPIRGGFGFGDNRSSHFSIGSGFVFDHFELNWATRTYFSPIASYAKGLTHSFDMILKF